VFQDLTAKNMSKMRDLSDLSLPIKHSRFPGSSNGAFRQPFGVTRDFILPFVFYLVGFAALTYPLLESFSSSFFADNADGLQNVWNIWWVAHAVLTRQSPWYTSYLHYPYGVSLLGHTLNPFNGVVAIVLLKFFSLPQTHNVIVVLAFVLGGVAAFLLCKTVTGAYWPSLIGGAVFTFSNYHFAHAQGHLQLVSLEWIPLFVLLWYKLLERPSTGRGIAAGITLSLVLLCDYYYFLYCGLTGAIMLMWPVVTGACSVRRYLFDHLAALAAFILTVLLTCAPLISALLILNSRDPLIGAHSSSQYSLDLAALVIPGGRWKFAEYTRGYWSRLSGNINESSVDLGVSVLLMFVYVWFNRSRMAEAKLSVWYAIAGTFAILALGPTLHVWGRSLPVPLPYGLLEILLPPLRLSGMPLRMVVMLFLSGGVITAAGLKLLSAKKKTGPLTAGLIVALWLIEYLPAAMPQTSAIVPQYVIELSKRPGSGGVLDLASHPPAALYYQTIHGKPLAFGYISRVQQSVIGKDTVLTTIVQDQDYKRLCSDYGIRYVVTARGKVVDLVSDSSDVCPLGASVDLNRISAAPQETAMPPDGTLVRGAGATIFRMEHGMKRGFVDWDTFLRYGGAPDLSNVVTLTERQLAGIPEGQPINPDEFRDAIHRIARGLARRFTALPQ
jgi:hypothetical protein